MTTIFATVLILVVMLGETVRSRDNERVLRHDGAAEPPDDVYRAMAWVYPLSFVMMGVEGVLRGRPNAGVAIAGLSIFLLAKVLKYWAIVTLGRRWTFRVLVPPDSPLVSGGPYAYLRHPNYVAVFGEIIGFALFAGASITGIASVLIFGALVRRRILIEERALGLANPEPRIPNPGGYT